MAYHGKESSFDVNVPDENSFRGKVLQEVAKIPYGEVKTYKQIAESLDTKAYRAVGTAIGRNPLPIIIPCHRVVRSE
jgi:methylated-DNA-[protein]-cysteine S-methyltransferase